MGASVSMNRRVSDPGIAAAAAASKGKGGAGSSAAPPAGPARLGGREAPGGATNPDRELSVHLLSSEVRELRAAGTVMQAQLQSALTQIAALQTKVAALEGLRGAPLHSGVLGAAAAPGGPPMEAGGARPAGPLPPLSGATLRSKAPPPPPSTGAAGGPKGLPAGGKEKALAPPAAAVAIQRSLSVEMYSEPAVGGEALDAEEEPAGGAPWACKQHELGEHDFFLSYRVWCDAQLAQTLFYALEAHRRPSDEAASAFLDQVRAWCLNAARGLLDYGASPSMLCCILGRGRYDEPVPLSPR